MSNAVAVAIPTNIALPAYLQTPDIAAQIAAENAAAAGGIRVGGFPKVSIEGGKFHEVNGGETNTFMMAPAAQGQPALPMMCFEAVIIAANPALVKKYYKDKWQKGSDAAPDCQSNNGVTPDASVASPQHSNCAQCPQNAWGSKISEATGKEVKACSDSKQMVVLPAWFQGWTEYKALGLSVTPAALGDWGKYVQALSGRSIPVGGVVTNITFDQTASYPKLMFSFNRFLTPDEFARVQERAKGDDVKNIVQPTVFVPPVTALPAPAPVQPAAFTTTGAGSITGTFSTGASIANFGAAPALAPAPAPASLPAANPALPPYSPPTVAAAPAGFGAAPAPAPVTASVVAEEPAKRTRAKRTPAPAVPTGTPVDMSHIPANIQATIAQVGGPDSPAGKALMAAFPAPVAQAPVATPTPVAVAPVAPPAPAPVPAFTAPAPAPAPNFATPAAPVATTPTAQATASGASLRDILQKKLGVGAGPGA